MIRHLKSLLVVVLGITFGNGFSQDVHFSQFYQTPLLVNPASTGSFNGDVRGIVNYRNQWTTVGSPYTTYAFSFDMGLMKEKLNNKYLGAGLFVYKDVAGDTKLSTTQVNFSLSSIITLNDAQDISAGIQGGFAQKSIDATQMQWGSQFDGNSYDPSLISGEPSAYENYTFGDFSGGLSWRYGKGGTNISSNDHFSANLGIAVYHINAPKQKFDIENLHREFVIHGGAYIGIKNTSLSVLPYVLMLSQGPLSEVNVGGLLRYSIREESKYTGFLKETAVFIGSYVRIGDAIIPTVMFEMANYAIGLSYDINISSLSEASSGNGGLEVSLRFINPNPFSHGKGGKEQKRSLF